MSGGGIGTALFRHRSPYVLIAKIQLYKEHVVWPLKPGEEGPPRPWLALIDSLEAELDQLEGSPTKYVALGNGLKHKNAPAHA